MPDAPPRARPRFRVPWPALTAALLALLVGGTALVGACGPSPLARAYDPFVAAAQPLLEDETQFWNQIAERSQDQEDARGVARYRQFLTEKAIPYYVDLGNSLSAIEPGHERLDAALQEMLHYARARRDFVELEVKRTDLRTDLSGLAGVQQAQETRDDARQAYGQAIADDVPDPRLADLTAVDSAVTGLVNRAVSGDAEPAAVVQEVQRLHLPRLRDLRAGRFDDTSLGKLFRKCVVATEEYHAALCGQLPAIIDAARAARRSEAALRAANVHQKAFQTQLTEAKRDR